MLTIKVAYPNSERVFEAKSFIYFGSENRLDGTDSEGGSFSIHIKPTEAAVVYVMNSSGSTVGKYHYLERLEE